MTGRDLDEILRSGLEELQPLPPLDLRDRAVAHLAHRRRRRITLRLVGAAAAIAVTAAVVPAVMAERHAPVSVAAPGRGRIGAGQRASTPTTVASTRTNARKPAAPSASAHPSATNSSASSGFLTNPAPTPGAPAPVGGQSPSTPTGGNPRPTPDPPPVSGPTGPIHVPATGDPARVAVVLDSDGLHLSATTVTGPEPAFTFSDVRGGNHTSLQVGNVEVKSGSTAALPYGVGALDLRAGSATARVAVVAPNLGASHDPAGTLTLAVAVGAIDVPNRPTAVGPPYVQGIGQPSDQRWAAITAGTYTVRFLNPTHHTRTYHISGYGNVFVPKASDEVDVTITFAPRADRQYPIYAVDDYYRKHGELLTLWLA